jgi:hypothetical protein
LPGYECGHIALGGDYAYIAQSSYGLRIVDISDPSAPELAATYNPSAGVEASVISGNFAYISVSTGLIIIDITTPETPVFEGECNISERANDIVISGNYAYLATVTTGLHIINITDTENPVVEGSLSTPNYSDAIYRLSR